jgi:hypothetical protein
MMESVDINEFQDDVNMALLWLERRVLYSTQHVAAKNQVVLDVIENPEAYREVLGKLIQKAPDTYILKWLEEQLEKTPSPKDKTSWAPSEIDRSSKTDINISEIEINLSVSSPPGNWLEDLERNAEDAKRQAEEIAIRPDIRKILCAALQTTSNDAFEIAKITTPILLGLVFGGVLAIPLMPMLFAAIALTIARAGIASFCANVEKKACA